MRPRPLLPIPAARRDCTAAAWAVATIVALAIPRAVPGQARARDPEATQSARLAIAIGTTASGDVTGASGRLVAFLPDCRRLMRLDAADSVALAAMAIPDGGPPAADPGTTLVLALLHLEGTTAECDVTGVTVRRGGRALDAVAADRLPARPAGPDGPDARRVGIVRVAVARTAIAPGTDGRVSDLVLEVHTAAGGAPKPIELAWPDVRAAWLAALAPRDLPAGGVARRSALASAGLGALAAGDSVAARLQLGALVAEEPCLGLAPSVAPEARAFTDGLHRPAARCTARSTGSTVLRSALLPGFGRPGTPEDRTKRVAVATAVVVAGVGTGYAASRARAAHEDYLHILELNVGGGMDVGDITGGLRQRESRMRALSYVLGATALATWGTQLVSAVRAEGRLARRLEQVRSFDPSDASRRLSLAPTLSPSALGVTLSLDW